MPKARRYRRCVCPGCSRQHWTSARQRGQHSCGPCQREAHNGKRRDAAHGITGYDRRVANSALVVRHVPVVVVGKCGKCRRGRQVLADGVCEDCRFYGMKVEDD